MSNEILKEQLNYSSNILQSKERFEKVSNLRPTEVLIGLKEDNTAVICNLQNRHTCITGVDSTCKRNIMKLIVAQLLNHKVPVHCYDDSYEIMLLFQNREELCIYDKSSHLFQSIQNLCRRRINTLLQDNCINLFEYNMKNPLNPFSNVFVIVEECSVPLSLLNIAHTVGVHFIINKDHQKCENCIKFINNETFIVDNQKVNFSASDLMFLLNREKTLEGTKFHHAIQEEQLDILTGKVLP